MAQPATEPPRRGVARRALVGLGLVVAVYLVIRAIAEPFVIDVNDPDTYRSDWGGPSLIGVLAVYSGPGLLIVAGAVAWIVRRRRRHADGQRRTRARGDRRPVDV